MSCSICTYPKIQPLENKNRAGTRGHILSRAQHIGCTLAAEQFWKPSLICGCWKLKNLASHTTMYGPPRPLSPRRQGWALSCNLSQSPPLFPPFRNEQWQDIIMLGDFGPNHQTEEEKTGEGILLKERAHRSLKIQWNQIPSKTSQWDHST